MSDTFYLTKWMIPQYSIFLQQVVVIQLFNKIPVFVYHHHQLALTWTNLHPGNYYIIQPTT
jgi:hypothetical protein